MVLSPRLQLQDLLEEILGSENVYFQPPNGKVMVYPCIVYQLDNADTKYASNEPYSYTKRYQITYISRNPDDLVPDKIAALPMSSFNRFFAAGGLNHSVLTLYFSGGSNGQA